MDLPPLPRSTSRLKIRDHINLVRGHTVEPEREIIFGPPAARSVVATHENDLVHKYLLYRSRLASKTRRLYFKWFLWIEDDIGRRMDDLVETSDQLLLKLAQVHQQNRIAAASQGPPCSIHLIQLGIEPSTSCPLLKHGDCIVMKADVTNAQSFFDHVVHMVLQDEIYRPMDMSSMYFSRELFGALLTPVPVVGVSLITHLAHYMITLWIPPQVGAHKYPQDEILEMLFKLVALSNADDIISSAVVVDNDSATSYDIFGQR